ncbi:MAG: hypothetical protein HY243_15915 [Proteobacteria bacterium]|nr:hypothetical protein [Pseudomonadota bacterium]
MNLSDDSVSDDEIVKLVAGEMQRGVGFGFSNDADLRSDRERALNYFKGEMPDVPSLPNRSTAVTSDVADAIYSILPDLMEIFTGGDDVAAFTPRGPEDEEAAQQETDYVNFVVFQQNDGFMTLHRMIQDALLEKVGVVTFWWEKNFEITEEEFEDKSEAELGLAMQAGEVTDLVIAQDAFGAPTYSFSLRNTKNRSAPKIQACAPEDFTIAADAISPASATYCAMRSRPRAQDLLNDGVDDDIVEKLAAPSDKDESLRLARDTAGESQHQAGSDDGNLRSVEIVAHFLRLYDEDAKAVKLWRIVTNADCTVLVERPEQISSPRFATVTPYPVSHRFYGRSVADLLLEFQRINTALTRTLLDSGYFALNQRLVVAMGEANDYTISDLLRNEPGVPIRAKTVSAVQPLASGALSFDAYSALEYFATRAEQRTGVVRNAQGLNPDTLHDTAQGALALMTAAQKRVRMIARIFAETGIKDLFLGVHALIREHATAPLKARLRNQWVDIDPSSWGERFDMAIEIGLGASGRAQDVAALGQALQLESQIVQAQGGASGPIVTPKNAYNLARKFYARLGLKNVEQYLSDPGDAIPQAAPSPDVQIAQMQIEAQRQMFTLQAAADAQAAQAKAQREQAQAERDLVLAREKMMLDAQLKREEIAAELQAKREQFAAELGLKREQMVTSPPSP